MLPYILPPTRRGSRVSLLVLQLALASDEGAGGAVRGATCQVLWLVLFLIAAFCFLILMLADRRQRRGRGEDPPTSLKLGYAHFVFFLLCCVLGQAFQVWPHSSGMVEPLVSLSIRSAPS